MMNQIIPLVALSVIVHLPGVGLAQARPAYETETWNPGRTLIWAHPGQDGELGDPNNWRLADGTSATTPPDRHTDVLLPAAESMYTVKGHRTDQVRHLTVERNGMFGGKHRNEVEIWGNAHLKAGGFAYYVAVRGDKHTFFRLDQSEYPTPENKKVVHHTSRFVGLDRRCRGHIAHKLQICKYGSASVEFIGKFGISDEIMVQHGRMIVNDEMRFSGATNKGALEVFDGAILEIQSGACVAPFIPDNRKCVYNVNIYRNGTLQAGSPERPLTRDARLLLGYATQDKPGRSGLYAAVGSMLRVYTTDPKTARLVISASSSDPTFLNGQGERIGDPDLAAQGNTGIALQLAGDMHLNGVHFDYICQQGIGIVGALQPATWANVTWGTHNAGAPAALFGELTANTNAYYHRRGDQKSEYGLTVRAVADMQAYLEQADPFRVQTLPANTTIDDERGLKTPAAVIFTEPVDVTIETRVPGAKIRYTLDGSEPVKTSPVYEGPIRLSKTARIMAKAYKLGVGFSPVFSTTYVINTN